MTPITASLKPKPLPPRQPERWGWVVPVAIVVVVGLLPLTDRFLSPRLQFAGLMPQIFVYALLSLGLTVVTGFTGMLNLGVVAFMAIGVYTYAILTCPVYPFQIGFWPGLICATGAGALAGVILGLPTMRLRGDYLAIVTLGFCEIVQDCLKNLEAVTKGTTGINPLPPPEVLGLGGKSGYLPVYYLFLGIVVLAVIICTNLKHSRTGRAWLAIREDELAARAMGIRVAKAKLAAFAVGAALCALGGGLFAALRGTSIEPGYYDFQNSIMVVASVIIGGLGSLSGALVGAFLIFGINLIVLDKLAVAVQQVAGHSANVLLNPLNWKCLIYGLALVLMMRFRPQGLIPERNVR